MKLACIPQYAGATEGKFKLLLYNLIHHPISANNPTENGLTIDRQRLVARVVTVVRSGDPISTKNEV